MADIKKRPTNKYLIAFMERVVLKYKVYNGLFITLPFEYLEEVGIELPVFAELCRKGLEKKLTPKQIVDKFFSNVVHSSDPEKNKKILILILQFVERQIVLFDALEDAAFKYTHDLNGVGTLTQLLNQATATNKLNLLYDLLKTYRTRIVLTAHPTQFYPPQVLSIIRDLTKAVAKDNINKVHDLLLQLGMTPFKSDQRPTPLDEAEILIQYLTHVFYPVLKSIHFSLAQRLLAYQSSPERLPAVTELGFWPGGDRDGNPNVTAEITLAVAAELKANIIALYITEIGELQHRLTFRGVWFELEKIKERLERTRYGVIDNGNYKNLSEFKNDILQIRKQVIANYKGLFLDEIDQLLSAVQIFGFYFAAMDLRQDSHIHVKTVQAVLSKDKQKKLKNYLSMSEKEKINLLEILIKKPVSPGLKNLLSKNKKNLENRLNDIIGSLKAAQTIQKLNGEQGMNRYVISHTQAASNVLEVLLFAHWSGWSIKNLTLDIIPLFESVDDLKNSDMIMKNLYENTVYKAHLKNRHNEQTVMLGFSDGTKDGGYVTASWEIFKCKIRLTELSKKNGIKVIFFDGRGGPPARGGGNTYEFYRAMENNIKQRQIQLTIQGQTISTMYGNEVSAAYNIEQLFTSALSAELFPAPNNKMSKEEFELLEQLSKISYESYSKLKDDKLFVPYLEQITPLNYYGELNIASRPPRRSGSHKFEDLRAISFVGAWSQMRQNVPGYYGFGTALKSLIDQGKESDLKNLYQHSLFFRTLVGNAMQSLDKSFFELTNYLRDDKRFGKFWQQLYNEAMLTTNMLKNISSQKKLLANEPIIRKSIKIRKDIVLPLLVIQQYALMTLKEAVHAKAKNTNFLKKIILKSLAGNINANRESA